MDIDALCSRYPSLTPQTALQQPWPVLRDLITLSNYRAQMRQDG